MRGIAIVPTYRNLRTLPAVLAELEAAGMPVLVIDDGSDDGTGAWLETWVGGGGARWMERFTRNRGKGAALADGLARARGMGFDFALSVDSDGQHLVSDAMRIAAMMEPGVMVVGARDESAEGYPTRSLFGRRLWALGVRSLTGLGVSDPVCGLRGYPLPETASIHVAAGRYAWEEEFLVRAAWAGIELREATIRTIYLAEAERVSHFTLGDWVDSFLVWARLTVLRLVGRFPRSVPDGPLARRDRSWRRITGAAVLVGLVAGAILPWFLGVPLLVFLAWRLHAPIVAAALAALLGSSMASASGPTAPVLVAVPLAWTVTRAARFLGSS